MNASRIYLSRKSVAFITALFILAIIVIVALLLRITDLSNTPAMSAQSPTTPTAVTDNTLDQPQLTECPTGSNEINVSGTCQPIIKGMSCNFISGSSSYTCNLSLYEGQKTFYCTQIGITSNCF